MERRVAGIIRWLERCVKAYKDGAVESALMDAECARADMENLRGDLWKKLDGRTCVRKRWLSSLKIAEAFFCAFAVMLFAATPLASQQGVPAAGENAGSPFSLEWVTPDEMELLSNIRKRPDDSVAKAAVPEAPAAKTAELLSVPTPAPVPPRAPEPARRRSPEPAPLPREQKKQETSLTYDSILSLIETGERAMKNDPPVIMVENAEGAAVNYE